MKFDFLPPPLRQNLLKIRERRTLAQKAKARCAQYSCMCIWPGQKNQTFEWVLPCGEFFATQWSKETTSKNSLHSPGVCAPCVVLRGKGWTPGQNTRTLAAEGPNSPTDKRQEIENSHNTATKNLLLSLVSLLGNTANTSHREGSFMAQRHEKRKS